MLGRLFGKPPESEERQLIDLSQYAAWRASAVGYGQYSPVPVTVHRALTHAASSACIEVLAGSVSTLPLDAVRQQGAARLTVSPTPPLIGSPSTLVESDVWMHQLVDSMLTDGNGWGIVTAVDSMQRPTSIELVDGACVNDRRVRDGVAQAAVSGEVHKLFPFGDLWHIPGKHVRAGSPFAESPIARAAATIGSALAAREFGARFFGDGGHPGGIITSTEDLNETQAQNIKDRFLNAVNGTREPAVFGSGLDYTPIIVDPNDSQFIDLMRFAIEEACRFWQVPPAMVYAATSGENITYANVTQSDLSYLKHSLEWLLVRIENALSRQLSRPVIARFNRNAFLRSDPTTRNEVYDRRLRNKSMSVNDVHDLEDEPRVDDPEYDKPGIPGLIAPTHGLVPAPTTGAS